MFNVYSCLRRRGGRPHARREGGGRHDCSSDYGWHALKGVPCVMSPRGKVTGVAILISRGLGCAHVERDQRGAKGSREITSMYWQKSHKKPLFSCPHMPKGGGFLNHSAGKR